MSTILIRRGKDTGWGGRLEVVNQLSQVLELRYRRGEELRRIPAGSRAIYPFLYL